MNYREHLMSTNLNNNITPNGVPSIEITAYTIRVHGLTIEYTGPGENLPKGFFRINGRLHGDFNRYAGFVLGVLYMDCPYAKVAHIAQLDKVILEDQGGNRYRMCVDSQRLINSSRVTLRLSISDKVESTPENST